MIEELDHRPFHEWEMHELGNSVQIKGVVIGDSEQSLVMLLPGEKVDFVNGSVSIVSPEPAELQDWLKATDDPKFEEKDPSGVVKAIHRKMSRHVDQELMWETYRRDNYTCQYCGTTTRAMTYDHWLAQAFGGETTLANGVTACRPCNKMKGNKTIEEWQTIMQERNFRGKRAQTS